MPDRKNEIHEFLDNLRNKKGFKASLSNKGLTIDFKESDIKRCLPNLYRELKNPTEGSVLSLNSYAEFLETDNPLVSGDDKVENGEAKNQLYLTKEDIERIERMDRKHLIRNIKQNVRSVYSEDSELFYPKTEDFIRRASTLEEAIEIINFQEKMGYIDHKEAERLKRICETRGIRYFGAKKEWGYYERTYRR